MNTTASPKGTVSRLRLPAWMLVPALLIAFNGLAFAGDPEQVVLRGAEPLAPATPTVFSGDLRQLPRAPGWKPGDPIKEIAEHERPPLFTPPPHPPQIDPLLAVQARAPQGPLSLEPPLLNFAGNGFTGVVPADTVGDVGIDHYIQMVNANIGAIFTVYNKSDGSVAAGPIALDSLGTGDCANGLGDGIVLYDQLADRWLLSELTWFTNVLCVYVSQTSNPITGGWFAYQFNTGGFPDYPKYGVWPDAYYVGANEGPAVYALDRVQMLVGGVAAAQRFSAPPLGAFGLQMLLPADADGETPPPPGAPNPFMRHRDDEAHNPGNNNPAQDFLEIWQFHVDFATPANSTFTGPTNIPIAEFDSDLCGYFTFSCFPQPSGPDLEPLREALLHRLQYRNFGDHQALVSNFETDVDGTDHGGVRWFELRNTGGGWSLYQEGTFAPDAHHRWMGSAAMDGSGNLGVGYSIASETLYPSIRFAARLASDPLGTLQGEVPVVAGAISHGHYRWGDYSSLNVDPVDDRTFWYTTMYTPPSTYWGTRIATFRLCSPTGMPVILGATAAAPNRIDVGWSSGNPPSDRFNVYRAFGTCSSPGPFVKIADAVSGFSFQDTTVSGGSTYAYRVTTGGVAGFCESVQSDCVEATATGVCTLPPVFAGLASATNQGTSSCGLSLAWTAATPACSGPVTYNVYRSTSSGFTPGPDNQIAAGVTGTSYTDSSPLASGAAYYYAVRAADATNGSAESNSIKRSAIPTGPIATTTLTETFEGAGGFDNPGWTHAALTGFVDWALSTNRSQTPTHSWFSASQPVVSSRALVSPPFVPQADSTLSFWHTYSFENPYVCFDGGTLESSADGGGTWSVLPDGAFTSGGFNGTVNPSYGNPLSSKRAWCFGTIGAMTQVTASLAPLGAGEVKLRWREGDDSSISNTGWYVDSVTLANVGMPGTCAPNQPMTPLDFYTLTPCRLIDTRNPAGPLGGPALPSSAQRIFLLAGSCGVPAGAKALSVNVTVTGPGAAGLLQMYPADLAQPLATILNFTPGQTRGNNAIVTLAFDGSGAIKVRNASGGTVHFILDVNGYFQ
jgi:hypothetical protein